MTTPQEQFDQALEQANEQLPPSFSERGMRALIPVGLGTLAVAQVASIAADLSYGTELGIGMSTYICGAISDRVTTAQLIRQNNSLKDRGITSPYYETNPLVDTSDVKSFMKDRKALAIDALLAAATVLFPVTGVSSASSAALAAHNNNRKHRRLKLAEAQINSSNS